MNRCGFYPLHPAHNGECPACRAARPADLDTIRQIRAAARRAQETK